MLPESCLTARRFKEGVVDEIAHLGAWRVQCRVVLEWVICRSMGGLRAASVTITLPVLLIALVVQRYIISGLTAGATKG